LAIRVTGLGTIDLLVDASAASSATGAGNLITNFQTSAFASASLFYTYDEAPIVVVAEPSSLMLIGLGMIGFAGYRRRKNRTA
jgi:hypothetical protein